MKVACAVCDEVFEARRASARYCSGRCRNLAKRRRDRQGDAGVDRDEAAVAKRVEGADESDGSGAKSELVAAVRKELAEADRLESVDGQIAVELAKQATSAGATGVSALMKELRVAMGRALEGAVLPIVCIHCGKQAMIPEPDDEVGVARRKREQKAREAASR